MAAKVQATATTPARERAARKTRLGDAIGKVIEIRDTANSDGGKALVVMFEEPVGERTVYVSGTSMKRLGIAKNDRIEFTAYELEDTSIDITVKSLGAEAAKKVFK